MNSTHQTESLIMYASRKFFFGVGDRESIVVIVILGILAAVAVPRMGNIISQSAESAEEAILAQLESAAEIKALDNVLLTGYKTYPSNPFQKLEKTPSGYTNGSDSGQDDAWWFASNKVYHRRNGNVYYWDYNPVNGEIN